MKLIFIDEVEQPHKAPGFFGIGALMVTSTFYRGLKEDVEDAFDKAGWDQEEEFKGRYLFSNTLGGYGRWHRRPDRGCSDYR
jgi:hypothetical protein